MVDETNIHLLMGLVSISACGPHMTLMINPKTGQYAECYAAMVQTRGPLLPLDQSQRTNCMSNTRPLASFTRRTSPLKNATAYRRNRHGK
jgi:hypothetical protein